ncbi:hypothetical protein AKI39_07100 [Bordetella sp. H567]|nr:hypothetical protein AKI39_07100 [Bordetella sp. H567]
MTAWLGLIAMCLVALAPTVSHLVRTARTLTVPVCTIDGQQGVHRVVLSSVSIPATSAVAMTVMAMSGMAGMSHDIAPDPDQPAHAGHGSRPMDDCGYCDLLNHAPALSMAPPAPLAPLLLLFGVFVLPALRRFVALGAFPSGRPRGPPAVS